MRKKICDNKQKVISVNFKKQEVLEKVTLKASQQRDNKKQVRAVVAWKQVATLNN